MLFSRVLALRQIPLFVGVLGVAFLVYLTMQQMERQAMNDPQITMADTLGVALARNESDVASLIPARRVHIQTELSPWVEIYDRDFNPILGNGYYLNALAKVPKGVLQQPGAGISNKVTWQPAPGVRQALVVYTIPRADGTVYVVSGRSMREGELRISQIGMLVALGTVVIMIGVLAADILHRRIV